MTRSSKCETNVRRLPTFPVLPGEEPGAGGELDDMAGGVPTWLRYHQLESLRIQADALTQDGSRQGTPVCGEQVKMDERR